MLVHRLRRWPNIKSALGQRPMFDPSAWTTQQARSNTTEDLNPYSAGIDFRRQLWAVKLPKM